MAAKADVRATMIDTIARFLDDASTPARGWTTTREGAERLAALLLDAAPTSGIGPLAVTRSLRQFRHQGAGRLANAPLPSWASCADDHCRTVRHCVHGHAAEPASACQARGVSAPCEAAPVEAAELTPAD